MMKSTFARSLIAAAALYWLFFVLLTAPSTSANPNAITTNSAVYVTLTGAIGPTSLDYIERSLEKAIRENASLFIIQIDTPGGLDTSMRDINQAILSSAIPVVTYVAPSGARAASAGTYILYASHIAAMAPATNLGAATPVQIGGMEPPSPNKGKNQDKKNEQNNNATDNQSAMRRKAINDAVAYIRGLAELRGRNVEWAEQAVRKAASLSASDALDKGVINFIANDIPDLLKQINGYTVSIHGHDREFNTTGMVLRHFAPDWRNQLLSVITDPNVAYILMLIGIYGLIFEFSNPGALVPGIAGAICLLLALFAFQVLPVNYAGFGLIALGILLMVAEAFVPSFGALGLGGVIAFVIGSIILMDTDAPGFGVSLPLIGSFALLSSALFTIVLVMAIKARRRPVVSGEEELIGAIGNVIDDFNNTGLVHIHGENWSASTNSPLRKGQAVRIMQLDGLTLKVEPVDGAYKEKNS